MSGLDGIRAVAVRMVLLHVVYSAEQTGRSLAAFPKPLLLIIGHGWLGVELAFPFSGFLVTTILLKSSRGPHYFPNFYLRRAFQHDQHERSICFPSPYLTHLSIFDVYMAVFRRFVPGRFTFADLALRVAVVISVSYRLALISREYLEPPFLALKRYVGGHQEDQNRVESNPGPQNKLGNCSLELPCLADTPIHDSQ